MTLIAAAAVYLLLKHRQWDAQDAQQQTRNLTTLAVVVAVSTLTLLWFLMLSPTPRWLRGVVLSLLAVSVMSVLVACRLRFDGDMRPYLACGDSALARPQAREDAKVTIPEGAANFAQFLGAERRGVVEDVELARDWQADPPRQVWRIAVGQAWSGFAVAGGRAITQEQRGDEEMVVCYELATGDPLWSHADATRYDTTIAGVGPRATPTIDVQNNRVYAVGATGLFNCLDLATGEKLWSADIHKDAGATPLEWGHSGSPLLVDDLVIVNPGGANDHAVIAYHAETGKIAWHAGSEGGSYASPMVAELAGVRQIIMLHQNAVTGHAANDGRVLWRHEWEGRNPKTAQPIVIGQDRVFISAGYGVGGQLFKVTRDGDAFSTDMLWKNIYLKAKFANSVLRGGHIYGLNDGTMVCINAATGARQWRGERYGHGQMLLVGDVILLQAESGDVVLIEVNADEFNELTRFTPLTENTWNSPTLAGQYLLVRHASEAACYELPVR